MKNIALVGFMGTGKSTVGRILAERLGAEFIDLDELIEREEGISVKEIFFTKGELYFRQLEHRMVHEVSQAGNRVISCGGGVVLDETNIQCLKQAGVVVCLQATVEDIVNRIRINVDRPLLNVKDKAERIQKLLEERQPCYDRIDFKINTSGIDPRGVAELILKLVRDEIEDK